jgi:hypothetical protein
LHAFQQGVFTGGVATDDTLEGLVALDVVGYTLKEALIYDCGRFIGGVGFRVG